MRRVPDAGSPCPAAPIAGSRPDFSKKMFTARKIDRKTAYLLL